MMPAMNRALEGPDAGAWEGLRLGGSTTAATRDAAAGLWAMLRALDLAHEVEGPDPTTLQGTACRFRLAPSAARRWAPGADTLELSARLGLDGVGRPQDLEREIVASLLCAPVAQVFPSFEELESAIRMRAGVVEAARRTQLHFDTEAIERPADCWRYHPDTGFTIRPGCDLAASLQRATQPEPGGPLYAFSCFRASEYVLLLGLVQEAARSHPPLHARLQSQAARRAIQGEAFQAAFLREYGNQDVPIPARYYVPGDRVWFRNPDDRSSDAMGYEGSWVIYLGGGLFSNFWQRERPYTLTHKCVELYHWRHAAYADAGGTLRIDESEVERRLAASLADPQACEAILQRMMRPRDPYRVYGDGGCIDTTREFLRWVRPGTCDVALPAH
jgi:hypothetical protein